MTMPSGERVNAELRAMGDTVPDVPDHAAEMGETGERWVVDGLPGGLGAREYRRPGTAS